MAIRRADGSIQLSDGRILYANSLILAQDLVEVIALLTPPPVWPFVSGGGGGGGGVVGRNGSQGAQGPAGGGGGSQGPQGDFGPQGFQGTNPGPQGNQGSFGPQGSQGNQGLTGSGAQGNQGNQGSVGPQGSQGNQGLTGSGAQGAQGNQGNVGVQGNQGNQGFQGALNPDIFAATRVVDAGGTGTDTTIAAAIAALPAEGGDIYVKQGTYVQVATLALPDKNVRIRGSGNATLITSPSGLPLFSVAAGFTGRYEFETFRVTGDNSVGNALISLDAAVDVSFEEVHTSAVRDIVVTSVAPEVSFSFCSFAMTAANNWSFWRGSATGGLLTWDYVDVTVGATQSTTGIVGNPEWTVTASYVGGGGPLTSSLNLGKTTIQGFRADKLRFILGSPGNRIVNLELTDGNVSLNNARTAIANSIFLTPTLSGTQVSVRGAGGGAGLVEHTISGCIFDSAGATQTNFQIEVSEVQGLEVVGCSFNNNGTGAGTDANIGVGDTGGTTELTVVGCKFTGGNPVQAVLEFTGLGTIRGRYDDNLGFSSATIVSTLSTVNGMRRYSQTGGVTTPAFVTLFTHTNTRGLMGIGTIKNTGGVNSLEVRETVTDAFGITDATTVTTVAPGNDYMLDLQTNFGASRPPYVSYMVEVRHPVAATTFNIAHGSQGSE